MSCHVYDPLSFSCSYPPTLNECMSVIFQPLWAIQMGMGALSTYEDFIFRPYVERRRFEWEGGDWDTKCSVTGLFTLMNFLLCDFWWMYGYFSYQLLYGKKNPTEIEQKVSHSPYQVMDGDPTPHPKNHPALLIHSSSSFLQSVSTCFLLNTISSLHCCFFCFNFLMLPQWRSSTRRFC